MVALHDGMMKQAWIVWESSDADVAFIKVQVDDSLSVVALAHHDPLLGQRVLAVGNPVGLGISVSSGIVSALNRDLKQSPYDRFIQTDAAINDGNSGGPLFDIQGEVVGMNSLSWTASQESGSEGLGFAIPATQLDFLIDQLKHNGRIECGKLGVRGQRLTPAMADALRFSGTYGVIVAAIDAGSVAARVGLKLGDIITIYDGKILYDVTTLNRATCLALDRSIAMKVWRDAEILTIEAHMTAMQEDWSMLGSPVKVAAPRFANANDLGMKLVLVDDQIRSQYRLASNINGYMVVSVANSSEAEAASLSRGDVITSLQVTSLSADMSFDHVLAQNGQSGRRTLIAMVDTDGGERWVTLPVYFEEKP